MVRISCKEYPVPQPDLTHKHEKIQISLDTKSGIFSMPIPEHIGDTMSGFDNLSGGGTGHSIVNRKAVDHHKNPYKLSHGTLKGLEDLVDRLFYDYKEELKKTRTKVICVKFKANVGIFENGNDRSKTHLEQEKGKCILGLDEISFAGKPALELQFYVGYKVGVRIFDLMMKHQMELTHKETDWIIMDFTPERFDFFNNAITAIEDIIMKLDNFTSAIKEDPHLLDEYISKSKFLPGGSK